jgi:hypothetical protein
MLGTSFALLYRSDVFEVNLAVMLLMGAGMGVAEAVTDAWLLEMHTRNESRLVTINHLAVSIGSVVITIYLMTLHLDWRSALVQVAVVLGALAVVAAVLRPAGHAPSRRRGVPVIKELSADASVGLLMLAAAGAVGL